MNRQEIIDFIFQKWEMEKTFARGIINGIKYLYVGGKWVKESEVKKQLV